MTDRHKVFVSYHHENDENYINLFKKEFGTIYVSKSVEIGDIDPNLKTETIRQKIRDEYLRDSTVSVVLIGKDTWKRKHIDWEIGSSLRHTQFNPRSGLLGIILPTRTDFGKDKKFDPYTIPPRLYDNIKCEYTKIYDWPEHPSSLKTWIDNAYKIKDMKNPNNSRKPFVKNRNGDRWYD